MGCKNTLPMIASPMKMCYPLNVLQSQFLAENIDRTELDIAFGDVNNAKLNDINRLGL